jgi:hypothetical protein
MVLLLLRRSIWLLLLLHLHLRRCNSWRLLNCRDDATQLMCRFAQRQACGLLSILSELAIFG